jgi:hypothetical protein
VRVNIPLPPIRAVLGFAEVLLFCTAQLCGVLAALSRFTCHRKRGPYPGGSLRDLRYDFHSARAVSPRNPSHVPPQVLPLSHNREIARVRAESAFNDVPHSGDLDVSALWFNGWTAVLNA